MSRALLVLVLLASPRAFAGGTCIVRGTSVTLQEVTVQPPRDAPFQLGLRDVPVATTLPAKCGTPLALDVQGDLVFKASRDWVRLFVTRDVTSPDGMVTAKRGAMIIDACVRGSTVVGSAILSEDDVLTGEHKNGEVMVHDFEVPCDALTLDEVAMSDADMLGFDPNAPAPPPEPAGAPADDDHDYSWSLRDEDASTVTLYSKPDRKSRGHVVDSPNCSGCISFHEVKLTRRWVLVESTQYGVTVRGWMQRSLGKREEDAGIHGGIMCTGDHGGGFWGEGAVANSFESEATVRIGTPVYANANGAPWGTFARDTRVKVRVTAGQAWAELRSVPGLDGSPSGSPWLNGLVHLSAVQLDPTTKP